MYHVANKTGVRMEFQNRDFIQLVKRTREKFRVSIVGAHDMIFADEEMRRLVGWRINHDQECRKQVLRDLRRKGSASRFIRDGDRLAFRTRDGQTLAEARFEAGYQARSRSSSGA